MFFGVVSTFFAFRSFCRTLLAVLRTLFEGWGATGLAMVCLVLYVPYRRFQA